MRWPWQKTEKRAGYTDLVLAALVGRASGSSSSGSAAREAGIGAISRAFAAARITGAPDYILDAIQPSTIAAIARNSVSCGEDLRLIDVGQGGLKLISVASFDVTGDFREETWRYRLDLAGPSSSTTRMVSGDQVIHTRYSTDPSRPASGVSPTSWASASTSLHDAVNSALHSDLQAASAMLVPVGGVSRRPHRPGRQPAGSDENRHPQMPLAGVGVRRAAGIVKRG